jgi:hypothetical protein
VRRATGIWNLVEYDGRHRRVWISGQRCHHGATGSIVALAGFFGLVAGQAHLSRRHGPSRSLAALALAGGALMAHDWEDRHVWFERGRGPMGSSAR